MAASRNRFNRPEIDTYVALMELSNQLRFRLEAHLREESELSQVQFDILGRLMRAPDQQLRMTDLADGMVISRSGLTYQVGQLAGKGLVARSLPMGPHFDLDVYETSPPGIPGGA